jgi:glycosyltransferase involved in cell wall biosynthesis
VVDSSLRILQVNSVDSGGGAAKVTWDLFQAYRREGHESWLVAGFKLTNDRFVRELDHDPYRRGLSGVLAKLWKPFRKYELGRPRFRALHRRTLLAVDARRINNRLMGIEDFEFPGTAHLFDLTPKRPDIVQCHNLHGNYFDLRELASLSHQIPVVLTLHDTWLLSGHCAYSLECERWQTGCGGCPDLTIPPPVRRDATAFNWQRKREIYSKSRLNIVTPSRWLMQKVEKSILKLGAVETRIIPNGVDISIFQPADQRIARSSVGIQQDTKVVLFAANNGRENIFKDYNTMQSAIALIEKHLQGQKMIFIVLGTDDPPERIGQIEIRFVPYQQDPKVVARYFQAADVYIHAARADNFPTTILEAMACGTPVVATAVGGIPEQISDGETGFLVPQGDAQAMAARIEQILSDDGLRQQMGHAAADSARRHFDLQRQVDDYLKWYERISKHWKPGKGGGYTPEP